MIGGGLTLTFPEIGEGKGLNRSLTYIRKNGLTRPSVLRSEAVTKATSRRKAWFERFLTHTRKKDFIQLSVLLSEARNPCLLQRRRGTAEAVDEEDEFHTNYI